MRYRSMVSFGKMRILFVGNNKDFKRWLEAFERGYRGE